MSKTKKTLTLVLSFVLVIALTIAGTIAYLTKESNVVTNTFTVGKIDITLDETKVDEYGVVDSTATDPVTANEYKLIPGHKYTKDPTIHVTVESEECWLAVKIENGLGTDATITMASDWTKLKTLDDGSEIWVYGKKVDAREEAKDVVVFTDFTFGQNADPTAYTEAKILVTAYAIQAEGFADAAAAYNGTFGATTNP